MIRRPFRNLLVANRGEIAVRIFRAAREMGIQTTAVCSDSDRHALHTRGADFVATLGPAPATESYLRIDKILAAAEETGADAIHPGYGFLAENPEFSSAVEASGRVFVGPSSTSMQAMGDKSQARQIAAKANVAVVPGYDGEDQSDARFRSEAERIGTPLLIKPSAGGGGKGMKRVYDLAELESALASARREAKAAFADDRLVLEKFLTSIRHIEIQVFADNHGNIVHLFERECSIQRRHQKIIEESPSVQLSESKRKEMGEAAVRLTAEVDYRGAGTVEFVLDEDDKFYFLEMNTRLQVEHPVTESITGVDLALLQLEEASGAPLPFSQDDISRRGHAIECRVYAEDPAAGFLPAAGQVLLFDPPEGPGIRVDSGIETGNEVTVHYDPILAKIIVSASDRSLAIRRMIQALRSTTLLGVQNNIGFLRRVLEHPEFAAGNTPTDFVAQHFGEKDNPPPPTSAHLALATNLMSTAESNRNSGRPSDTNTTDAIAYHSPWKTLTGFRLSADRESTS